MTGRLLTATAVAAVAGGLVSGCSGDGVDDELRASVGEITVQANEGDADGVRSAVAELLAAVDEGADSGELSGQQADDLRARATAVLAGADGIDPDVLARREAERAAQQAQAQLEAEREAAARDADGERKGKGKGDKDDEEGSG